MVILVEVQGVGGSFAFAFRWGAEADDQTLLLRFGDAGWWGEGDDGLDGLAGGGAGGCWGAFGFHVGRMFERVYTQVLG